MNWQRRGRGVGDAGRVFQLELVIHDGRKAVLPDSSELFGDYIVASICSNSTAADHSISAAGNWPACIATEYSFIMVAIIMVPPS